MLDKYRQIKTLSLVLVGEFNPTIVQPFWLAQKKLIRAVEAENAKVEVIHHEIVKYSIDWAQFEISPTRLELRTTQEPYFEPLKDLCIGIFKILAETPLRAMGINHILHYTLDDSRMYQQLGDRIAPLANWNQLLPKARILSLEVIQQEVQGRNGHVRLRIEPSDSIKESNSFMLNINDHYDVAGIENHRDGTVIRLLNENWKASFTFAAKAEETLGKIGGL